MSNNTGTEHHIRLAKSLITSEAYQDLNKNALKVLNAMKLISRGNEEFEFSTSLGVEYLGLKEGSEKGVRLAIKELVSHGFIKHVTFSNGAGHQPNKFAFDTAWRIWGN
ncbi:MAG: hypothetical protein J6B87_06435 [Clostridia bacterium]|nr:hypothetical protein [Clostridia bacterium]